MNGPAWNGGSPEAARAEADKRRDDAWSILKSAYLTSAARDPIGCTEPFVSTRAPGWVYLPIEDTVILADTAKRLRDIFV